MSVTARFFRLLCNKAIPVSSTGMTGEGGTGMTGEGGTGMTGEGGYFHDIILFPGSK
ncbi:hypothetical protein [Wolbachia endosymbiont (group A) of Tiphia femorata]|uniref:hypothetical protein n=1 Tax=Wolbachia endosymbiont (group A) of Tiphia femorata TaxID=2954063 RepID=UPI00222E8ACA|nr:hypothetical protein [Wolbachia endosymbiont (group A) of Tiphia femorata]